MQSAGRRRYALGWIVGVAGVVLAAWLVTRLFITPSERPPLIVGAYYYTWYYEGHWASTDYVGRHLPAPLEPQLGEYVSDAAAVIDAHLKWAAEYGIDFFIISWSHPGSFADQSARKYLLPAMARSRIRQAPFVELNSYGERNLANPEFRARLQADLRYVGENFLKHPSALHVNGKPVLMLYVTRILQGDVGGWIQEVRRMLADMGVDPFIVADEVFWQDVDPARLRAFDAVTAYNVYDWPRKGNAGFAGDSMFLADVEGLFTRWQKAAQKAGVVFVPNAMPGYNDRGVRPAEDHYVIPRRLQPASSTTSLFERSVALAKRFVDPTVPIVTITSFNEWHEWTQVEPARPASRPAPADAASFTQGFPHDAYSLEYLEVIRDNLGDGASGRRASPKQ
jgi:glycoprotein endo-alpha-1,2-mannosidase